MLDAVHCCRFHLLTVKQARDTAQGDLDTANAALVDKEAELFRVINARVRRRAIHMR